MSKPIRKSMSKKLRFEIFKRDRFTCQYCGAQPPDVVLEVDHVIAVVDGGPDDEANLVTSCFDCNRGKGPRALTSVPESIEARTERAQEVRDQVAAFLAALEAERDAKDDLVWEIVWILEQETSTRRARYQGIANFFERMDAEEVFNAARLAELRVTRPGRGRFLFFAKVCWNIIKGVDYGAD